MGGGGTPTGSPTSREQTSIPSQHPFLSLSFPHAALITRKVHFLPEWCSDRKGGGIYDVGHSLLNNTYFACFMPQQLKLQGIEIAEGTDYKMENEFLMEIMDINEKLAEAQSEAAINKFESTVRGKR